MQETQTDLLKEKETPLDYTTIQFLHLNMQKYKNNITSTLTNIIRFTTKTKL